MPRKTRKKPTVASPASTPDPSPPSTDSERLSSLERRMAAVERRTARLPSTRPPHGPDGLPIPE